MVSKFIKIFIKIYSKIHNKINPSLAVAKVAFATTFDSNFALMLREKRLDSLARMKIDVVEIESNITSLGKFMVKA